jgi:hypothetical protein
MQNIPATRKRTLRVILNMLAAASCLLLAMPTAASSQTPTPAPIPPRVTRTIDLSGPRFGLTMLSPGNVDALKERGITVRPLISQFGWQFERRFYSNGDGVTALTEWVPLLSGLDQGVALPSLNWLVGVRTATGTEFGIGPNVTPTGVGLVVVGGVTVRSGALNVPLNFAVTTSKSGARVTILTGFNLRR